MIKGNQLFKLIVILKKSSGKLVFKKNRDKI